MAGVVTGVVLGIIAPAARRHRVAITRALFAACVAGLAGLAALSEAGDRVEKSRRFAAYVALMAIAGAGSIGFIGVALPICCALAHPVSEAYSAGLVELLVQVAGV
eukprot:gene15452-15342_t